MPMPVAAFAGDRVRRRDERIRAVVEIEQRPLRALEQNVAPFVQRAVDEQRRVGHVRTDPLRERLEVAAISSRFERRHAVDALEPDVLLRERDLDLLAEDLRVEQVLHADSEPRGLVRVAGPDAALRRADLQLAESPLARLVDRDVPRHDQVRLAGEMHGRRVESPRDSSSSTSVRKHLGIDDAARADHARLAAEHAARDLADLEGLAVDDDRVAGVRAALVAADEIGVLREQVDDLALPLVSPLRADDDCCRHATESARALRLGSRVDVDSGGRSPVRRCASRSPSRRASCWRESSTASANGSASPKRCSES